jgi:hypothetical protein
MKLGKNEIRRSLLLTIQFETLFLFFLICHIPEDLYLQNCREQYLSYT